MIDQGNLTEDTQGVFVVKGETSRSHEIDDKDFHEKLCASDRSGQLEITLSELVICLKTPVLSKLTMDQGNLMSVTAQVHTQ